MNVERLGRARLSAPGKGDQQGEEKTEQVTG